VIDDETPADPNGEPSTSPGQSFLGQLREHPGFLLSLLALILLVGITFVAVQPLSRHTPRSSLATPSGSAPPPSATGVPYLGLNPALAYDPVHHQVVLLNQVGETWLWSGSRWTLTHSAVGPRGRYDAAMAWDPRLREVLLFGGFAGQDEPPRDTWAWNGSSWRQVEDGTVSPPGGAAGMAYDAIRGQMVLLVSIGRGTSATMETWTWDGAQWQQRSQPSGTAGPILPIAFDGQTRTVLSTGARCSASGCYSETWSWDGAAWHRLAPLHEPGASAHMTLARDPVSGQLLLLTVADVPHGVPFPTETWRWDGRDWVRLSSVGKPGSDVYAVSAGDGGQGTVWAFEDITSAPGATRVDGAWAWTGTTWVQAGVAW